jgi:hypothetical protein
MSYTKGPWKLLEHEENMYISTEDDVWICDCGALNNPDILPNARLIAAAPELLEALETIFSSYEQDANPGSKFTARIRALIAKAKGEI